MKTSKTKKKFLLSLVAVIACVAMLIGTTFAWFTDSVSNTGNRIQAGTLDIDLLMDKGDGYVSIANGQGDIFKEAAVATNSNATLWEPGKTQFAKLAVENKGSLALKYVAYIDVTDNGLASALEYALVTAKEPISTENYNNWAAVKAAVGESAIYPVTAGRTEISTGVLDEIANTGLKNERDYVLLAVHMKEEAGNEFQGKDVVIDVNIVATQKDAESDAFGSDYDKNAQFPVVAQFPSIKKDDLNTEKTVTITNKGAIQSAKVPAKGTAAVFNELKMNEDQYSNDLTLTLSVNKTSNKVEDTEEGKKTTVDLDINMSAIMTSTNVSTKEVTTKTKEKVESLSEFTTIQMDIGEYDEVSALHNGEEMEPLDNAESKPSSGFASIGGYFYDGVKTLTVVTKTFSPFTYVGTKSNMPKKGTLIKMDLVPNGTTIYPVAACPVDEGGNETYRVLKTEGQKALVLAMYDVEKEIQFTPSATKTTFDDGGSYMKYNGSTVDVALNTTFYGKLSQDAKSAIVAKTINQSAYEKWYGTIAGVTYTDKKINDEADIKFLCKSSNADKLLGAEYKAKVSVGERNVFALDLSEIDEYFAMEAEAISANNLFEFFYNMAWNENLDETMPNPWLRTGSANETSYAWYLSGTSSFSGPLTSAYEMTGYGYWGDFPRSARPAFYIDLSQIDWAKVE